MKTVALFLLLAVASPWFVLGSEKTDPPRKMLIVTCHPDDWEIGMAGTAYLLKDKYQIHVVIASDGELGNTWDTTGKPDPAIGAMRVEHADKSGQKIHATNHFFKMKDSGVYADENAVNGLIAFLKEIDPAILFLHWPIDKPDHAAASAMASMALAKAGMMYDREIYFFEVGKLDHFTPSIYVDVTPVWETKQELVKIHERFGDDRFRKMAEESALSHGRAAHCKYAEGFIPLSPLANVRYKHRTGCSLIGL